MTNGHRTVINQSAPLTPEDVFDAKATIAVTYARDTSHTGVCVADGMGLRIFVDRGALVVEDGMGEHRRSRRFDRATHGLSRLVVLGSTGNISLDALGWCRKLGIGVIVLTPDGTPVLASTPRMTDDARLRRIQAQAPDQQVGLDLARSIIADKLFGQARVLTDRFSALDHASTALELIEALASTRTIDEVRQIEASAAAVYWQSWVGRSECVPQFAAKDRSRIPPHWMRYEGRRSVLASTNANRKAERPVNALENYAYALLEAEAILACHVVGLDPGLGLIHNDAKGRQSLALDLLEPVRPDVDTFILDLLQRRTFRKVEFTETADGQCRLKVPLTHELAEMMPIWAKALAPIAEKVAHTLGQAMAGKYVAVTPLTRMSHRQAQALVKARKTSAREVANSTTKRQRPATPTAPTLWSCPDCGGEVTNHRRIRCDDCIDADPSQSPEVRGRRGAAIAARKRALREWDETHPDVDYDPELFRREILPRLATVKLAEITEAAGVSKSYASTIRSGKFTPHVSTWKALGDLVVSPIFNSDMEDHPFVVTEYEDNKGLDPVDLRERAHFTTNVRDSHAIFCLWHRRKSDSGLWLEAWLKQRCIKVIISPAAEAN
jgi:CRISPR-associated endonuclease Cas1